ncbi:universal stress protein [Halodesulfurarchaeum sp.]|uniref:universal stress protein n=1 Tax=Halodesulfurarchaeum sp. TaxID=1980530 RepID=UPI002FC2B6D9
MEELSILVPVDISQSEPPAFDILDFLQPFEVILLGYFPVPDQAEPALIKHEYEVEAKTRLDSIAKERNDITEVLVFTHDREATIDRVADQYDCDAVLTPRDVAQIERIIVPIRGDVNNERIISVVVELLKGSQATATFFHSIDGDVDSSKRELLLRGTVDRITQFGIDAERIDCQIVEDGDPYRDIVTRAEEYDIVILGETEPSLRERIIGDVLSRIIDDISIPALIVRDVK